MNPRFSYDADDPFGTRPDEKPPTGWDAQFFDGVRRQIESRRREPDHGKLPEPERQKRMDSSLLVAAFLTALGAAAMAVGREAAVTPAQRRDDASRTIVHVDGSQDPAVAVEWARLSGRRSGYVVFQSLSPEISYVVVDRRLASP